MRGLISWLSALANLERWIEHPQQMLPGNAMPEMGLSQPEVRVIVNYLYTLE